MQQAIEAVLAELWQQYTQQNPEALAIYQLFKARGEKVVNDHIALRTFDDPRVDINVLGAFFTKLGYEASGNYQFTSKHLIALHYEHKANLPKIFISQLQTREFSPFLQQQVQACVNAVPKTLLSDIALLYSGSHWPLDYAIYQQLLAESEYAAWLYVFGWRANHFTVAVNYLQSLTSLEAVNDFLKQQQLTLNTAGGEIKGTPAELLEQSSTMANKVMVQFKQGEFAVLNSYYEFARRYPDQNGKLYQGFIAASADKIFESTHINRG